MELGTIHEEAALCRAAWVGRPIGTIAIHCHHEMEIEPLTETAENRITYILQIKPESEQALRLRLFRPSIIPAKLDAARAKWGAARAKLDEARAELDAAWAKWDAARAELDEAWAELDAARAKWGAARAKLDAARAKWDAARAERGLPHSAFCTTPDCPWDGKTIFPKAKG